MAKPLTIGVDVRDIKVAKTGTRTYLIEICREFKKLESETVKFKFLDTSLPIYGGGNKLLKWVGHFQYQFWKQISLPLKAWTNKCDVVFCTDNFVPIIHLGYTTVPVFHDAFFFENPENYGRLWLWLYMKTALPAAKRSPVIVTPTAYSKQRIHHFTGIAANKLVVVTEGAPVSIGNQNNDLKLLNLPVESRQYILHAGSFFKRKNLPALIAAFAKLKADGFGDLKLVLAGPTPVNKAENDYHEVINAINDYQLGDAVILTGYLPDEHLQILYKHALLYAFPSINEGFGLPVLEAFRNGVPVVVANNTCLPEVGGDAVLTFDPFNIEAIAAAMKEVLLDDILKKEMITKGHQQLKKFTWAGAAEQLVEIFKNAANCS
ncbi:glycosyltransferase family 4 protein [Mucilaginibacter auburnensis]|uniref:Glycosyltransferase involved in cell wall biosynthesis n=1 Tax=Mucilaginibacter auburnensis TaxID=1457233 RepID=A0A2H9VTB9_9SPHI|nr:glycosyltransferase family 1 protein [Mucilaginibacter auburnensis]PJJ84077.1 glycosyltransferase involved in cell wall biosynthesis [Mucilaginibacter auburnensis]